MVPEAKAIWCLFLRSTHVAVGWQGEFPWLPVAAPQLKTMQNKDKPLEARSCKKGSRCLSAELSSEQVSVPPFLTLLHIVGSPCRLLQFSYCSAVLLLAQLGSAATSTAGPVGFTLLGRRGKQGCQGANSTLPRPQWVQPHLATVPSAPCPRGTSSPLLSSTSHKGITEMGGEEKRTGCRGWIHRCCADILQLERTRKKV